MSELLSFLQTHEEAFRRYLRLLSTMYELTLTPTQPRQISLSIFRLPTPEIFKPRWLQRQRFRVAASAYRRDESWLDTFPDGHLERSLRLTLRRRIVKSATDFRIWKTACTWRSHSRWRTKERSHTSERILGCEAERVCEELDTHAMADTKLGPAAAGSARRRDGRYGRESRNG